MEMLEIKNNVAVLNDNIRKELIAIEEEAKRIKEIQDTYKKAILEEMESKNIIKIETDDISINYIAPTDRETFDSKHFREEHQDLYDEYIKMTPVKSSIRIKIK